MNGPKHDGSDAIDFHHPYQPYQIQKDLMRTIYNCIEHGNVGIFESPTGTGKSLSVLCGSLTWLRNHKTAQFSQATAVAGADDEPEWMREHARSERRDAILRHRADLESKLQAVREKERRLREATKVSSPRRKRAKLDHPTEKVDEDAAYLLDDYASDGEQDLASGRPQRNDGLSDETKRLLRSIGLGQADEVSEDAEIEDELKIFICSRTHSQLSQLVGELRRIRLPSAFPVRSSESAEDEYPIEGVKQLSLGSRKNLCINNKVRNLGSVTRINERCLELQESKTPQDRRCGYLPSKENQTAALDFKYYALARVRDIEDLSVLGTKIGVCPYYATRPVIRPAELVTLPYPLLLQKSAREALDISVKDHVVIIDEAHNLMDAILGIHTTEITLAQLLLGRAQLMTYLQKFRNRLAGKNRVYVTQTVRLLDSIKAFLEAKQNRQDKVSGGIVQSGELLAGKGVDQINLYQMVEYLQTSKLARKVHGYVVHKEQEATTKPVQSLTTQSPETAPVLNHFQSFIMTLMNPAKEGRFFWSSDTTANGCKLKYLLLDPSEHFKDIVSDARSVILVGGTMSPMNDYRTQLFPFVAEEKLTTLSCGHVIPQSNLFVSPLPLGANGQNLDFTFSSRNSNALLRDLGYTIVRLVKLIPDGVVLFFPSYSYLDQVLKLWRQAESQQVQPIAALLEREKKVFIDSQAVDTELLLQQYSAAIMDETAGTKGAVLMSVIGGKLSEGINFSDRLGRCVMVVGLPYPNPNSQEWKAKMEYVEEKAMNEAQAAGKSYARGSASRDFADNVCMRAVNQAIGRAVRHKDDWAGILLLDQRYCQKKIQDKLPKWMTASSGSGQGQRRAFAEVEREMRKFYTSKLIVT
ncbi:ATP-dependent RNA helicase-like protein chl1 [Myriangium duriaei CBS 260.36]|uniref:ATP-dependent DNA helicase CHL1 n=1 Tax=Myriangium duriaei CBS 260.36 TaxID=1168546 RepID=A0A9P4IZD7_9PEZI|nr:ATP-dependent RNA helicase-like protein chl1 [Myriangium duriaei CBS 260.36]